MTERTVEDIIQARARGELSSLEAVDAIIETKEPPSSSDDETK